jgi:hypothetical protein
VAAYLVIICPGAGAQPNAFELVASAMAAKPSRILTMRLVLGFGLAESWPARIRRGGSVAGGSTRVLEYCARSELHPGSGLEILRGNFMNQNGPVYFVLETGCLNARSTMSFGSVDTGPSRQSHRIISGIMAPPNF